LSNRKAARFVVRFVVLGACAGTLAAFSAYAKWPNRVADKAMSSAGEPVEPQVSNRAAKTDRLAVAALLPDAGTKPAYVLASAQTGADLERFTDSVTGAMRRFPEAAEPKAAEPKAADNPTDKPKRLLPPPPPPATGLLDDGQISGLKGRLRLTSDQAEYWPAVEAALRDVVRTQMRGTKRALGGKVNIDTNSPEVQKLIWAAMPLLMRLREDQKSEVRKLARVIGLEQVASQI
jgi:hypothetical protein